LIKDSWFDKNGGFFGERDVFIFESLFLK